MKTPKISIQIGADTRKLKRDMKNADGIIGKFTSAAKLGLASAAAAAGAFAFKLGTDGVEAAIADEASQVKLAKALANTTKATDAQIASVEDYISKTQMRYGIEDTLLRSSLSKLATKTGDVTKAQEYQNIALDVAAGANISLEAATNLVVKALGGSFLAFKKLGVTLDDNITKNKDGAKAVEILGKTYEGAAKSAADTTQGKLDRLNEAWNETVEAVGYALLPSLQDLADWATSPEGGKAIADFAQGLADAVTNTVQAVQDLKQAFDDLTSGKTFAAFDKVAAQSLGGKGAYALSEQGQAAAAAAIAASQATYRNALLGISPTSKRAPFSSLYGQAPINITVNGAIDPVSTARQIQKLLNQVPRSNIPPDISKRSK